jgi:hypothetical protein
MMRRLSTLLGLVAVIALAGFAGWTLLHRLPVPAPQVRADPVEQQLLATLDAAREREAVLRQQLDELRPKLAAAKAQCRPPLPRASGSSLPEQVKPSMPSAAKRPVEVQRLPPPR